MTENKTITIDGKQYPVEFDMATLCAFEQTTGHSFFEEKFEMIHQRLILVFAALFAANENFKIDILMKSKDWMGITKAYTTVMEMAADFFKLPDVVANEEAREAQAEGDGKQKNA